MLMYAVVKTDRRPKTVVYPMICLNFGTLSVSCPIVLQGAIRHEERRSISWKE